MEHVYTGHFLTVEMSTHFFHDRISLVDVCYSCVVFFYMNVFVVRYLKVDLSKL